MGDTLTPKSEPGVERQGQLQHTHPVRRDAPNGTQAIRNTRRHGTTHTHTQRTRTRTRTLLVNSRHSLATGSNGWNRIAIFWMCPRCIARDAIVASVVTGLSETTGGTCCRHAELKCFTTATEHTRGHEVKSFNKYSNP